MDILRHFSTYTNLPVKVDDVRGYIADLGIVDLICIHEVDTDPEILWGTLYMTNDKPPYYQGDRTIANVAFSKHLPDEYKRLVGCKELLHILDTEALVASKRESVEELIDEMTIPRSVQSDWEKLKPSSVSDHSGVVLALAVLFPAESIELLRPSYQSGDIGIEEIAALAHLPEAHCQLAMSEGWTKVINMILDSHQEQAAD